MGFLCKLLLGCFMAAYWLNGPSRNKRDQRQRRKFSTSWYVS